jgi:hypothetical protein
MTDEREPPDSLEPEEPGTAPESVPGENPAPLRQPAAPVLAEASAPPAPAPGPEPAGSALAAEAAVPAVAESETRPAPPPPPAAPPRPPAPPGPAGARSGAENRARPARGPHPVLSQAREPVFRESGGYRLRLDPPDLARLRELPGSKGKTDRELGEEFLAGHEARLTAAIAGDVPVPAELRVVVDPYSRQAFLALENRIRGITSF